MTCYPFLTSDLVFLLGDAANSCTRSIEVFCYGDPLIPAIRSLWTFSSCAFCSRKSEQDILYLILLLLVFLRLCISILSLNTGDLQMSLSSFCAMFCYNSNKLQAVRALSLSQNNRCFVIEDFTMHIFRRRDILFCERRKLLYFLHFVQILFYCQYTIKHTHF